MRSVLRAAAVPLAVLLGTGGCGNSPLSPGLYTLEGVWSGRGYPYELSLDLNQDADNGVRGEGELRGLATRRSAADTPRLDTIVATRAPVGVRGKWDYPAFNLALEADTYADIRMAGRFAGADSMTVTLTGSGFSGTAITLVRTDR